MVPAVRAFAVSRAYTRIWRPKANQWLFEEIAPTFSRKLQSFALLLGSTHGKQFSVRFCDLRQTAVVTVQREIRKKTARESEGTNKGIRERRSQ